MGRICGSAVVPFATSGKLRSTVRKATSPRARPAVHGSSRDRKAITRSMVLTVPLAQARPRITLLTLGNGSRSSLPGTLVKDGSYRRQRPRPEGLHCSVLPFTHLSVPQGEELGSSP